MNTQQQNPNYRPQTERDGVSRGELFALAFSLGAFCASVGWFVLLMTFRP